MDNIELILYGESIEHNLKMLTEFEDHLLSGDNKFLFICYYRLLLKNVKEFINSDPSSLSDVLFKNHCLTVYDRKKNYLRDSFYYKTGITLSYSKGYTLL